MSEQCEKLKAMNLEIQKEEAEIKFESNALKDRKKNLEMMKKEYMKQTLEEFEKK